MDFHYGDRVLIIRSTWEVLRGTTGTVFSTGHEKIPNLVYVKCDTLGGKTFGLDTKNLRKLDAVEALARLA